LTISLFTNAGFDITGDSLMRYSQDYYLLTLSMILIFLGGVGFFALIEMKQFVYNRLNKQRFKFSLYVKIVFKIHVYLVLLGAVLIAFLEKNQFLVSLQ